MNLIRNSKSILLISVIIISSIGIGYFAYIMDSISKAYSYRNFYGNIYFEYEVTSCGDYDPDDTFKIIVSSLKKEVIFHQNFSCYCGPPAFDINYFRIELELLNNDLTIREIFDNKGTPVTSCVCWYRINGKIVNLAPGTYNLIFIEDNRFVSQTRIVKVFEINL